MQSGSHAKIVSVPKNPNMKKNSKAKNHSSIREALSSYRFKTIIGLFGVLLGISLVIGFFLIATNNTASPAVTTCVKTEFDSAPHSEPHTAIGTRTCILRLERADTPEAREKGLSGRQSMSGAQGMIFVFDDTGTHCMWMKDMHFAIDILWLDASGTILKVEKNVKPETYPATYCGDNARMVVEVKAGVSEADWLQVGRRI